MTRRKYRSLAGIILDILETLNTHGPMPATRIATYANLPYDRLKPILETLEEKHYVEKTEDGYTITDEGRKALAKLREAANLLRMLGYKL